MSRSIHQTRKDEAEMEKIRGGGEDKKLKRLRQKMEINADRDSAHLKGNQDNLLLTEPV